MQARRHTRRAFFGHSIVRTLPLGGLAVVVASAACQRTDEVAPPTVREVTVSPTSAYVAQGTTKDVLATVRVSEPNTRHDVVWTLQGDGCAGVSCGTISFPGRDAPDFARYEAPAAAPDPPLVTMTATSIADPSKTANARFTIGPTPITITIDHGGPMEAHTGDSIPFVATITGDPYGAGVSWSFTDDPWDDGLMCESYCGSFSSTATASGQTMTFTVGPASGFKTLPFPIWLRAASVTDPSKQYPIEITVSAP